MKKLIKMYALGLAITLLASCNHNSLEELEIAPDSITQSESEATVVVIGGKNIDRDE